MPFRWLRELVQGRPKPREFALASDELPLAVEDDNDCEETESVRGEHLGALLHGAPESQTVAPALDPPSAPRTFDAVPKAVRAGDSEARRIFADWLEEQGLEPECAWLRLEAELFEAPEDDELREEMSALHVAAAFQTHLARSRLEHCDRQDCPGSWQALAATEQDDVKHCERCRGDVRFAATLEQAQTFNAEKVRFAVSPEVPTDAELRSRVPWPVFVKQHRTWSDAAQVAAPYLLPVPPLDLDPHPLWSSWRDELAQSPVKVSLVRDKAPGWEPTPTSSYAGGGVAFLERLTWPRCGQCNKSLELVFQLAPEDLRGWLPGDRGLVAMHCFQCYHGDQVSFVECSRPAYRILRPPEDEPFYRLECRRVRATPPERRLPDSGWYRARSPHTPEAAASRLFGYEATRVVGPFPGGFSQNGGAHLENEWDNWVWERGSEVGYLGFVPHWDQDDATPTCHHGEMLHLLDFNGDFFLDGALHVFVCRAGICEALRWIVEF